MSIWHEALSDKLKLVGFIPSKSDPDLWIRDAGNHYEYIYFYSYDVLVFSKNPMVILQGLNNMFPFKGVGRPELYIEVDIDVYKYDIGNFHYVMSSRTYIKNICDKI